MKYASLRERIVANARPDESGPLTNGEPCWIWRGPSRPSRYSKERYPRMSMRRGNPWPNLVSVTRLVIELWHGLKMTRRHVAAHECNRPLCVNPAHLRRDTQRGNIRQAREEGRLYRRVNFRDGSRGCVLA